VNVSINPTSVIAPCVCRSTSHTPVGAYGGWCCPIALNPDKREHLPATDPFDGWEEFNFPTPDQDAPLTFTNISGEYTEEDILRTLEHSDSW